MLNEESKVQVNDGEEAATVEKRKKKFNKKGFFKNIFNWFLIVFIAAVAGYSLVTFFFQTIKVVGPSMNDTLEDGQVVIVNKFSYSIGDVERYDIIAFSQVETGNYFEIKRVIGLPGETVQIKDGFIYIDGVRLEDTPFDERIITAGVASSGVTLSKEEYFVLGDNVNNSEDSRYTNIGKITKSEILGKVIYIVNPKEDRGKVE